MGSGLNYVVANFIRQQPAALPGVPQVTTLLLARTPGRAGGYWSIPAASNSRK